MGLSQPQTPRIRAIDPSLPEMVKPMLVWRDANHVEAGKLNRALATWEAKKRELCGIAHNSLFLCKSIQITTAVDYPMPAIRLPKGKDP